MCVCTVYVRSIYRECSLLAATARTQPPRALWWAGVDRGGGSNYREYTALRVHRQVRVEKIVACAFILYILSISVQFKKTELCGED